MMPADLPVIGTRWGDLTPEQRASLPVGTVLRLEGITGADLRRARKVWIDRDGHRYRDDDVGHRRHILSYHEVTP